MDARIINLESTTFCGRRFTRTAANSCSKSLAVAKLVAAAAEPVMRVTAGDRLRVRYMGRGDVRLVRVVTALQVRV